VGALTRLWRPIIYQRGITATILMRVSLIDKHPILRRGMSLLLHNFFTDIQLSESDDFTSFSSCPYKRASDLIIIGLSNESLDVDFQLIKNLKLENPHTNFIIYAETAQHAVAVNSLIFGVKGYILKNSDPGEMVACIETVTEGNWYISSSAIPNLSDFCPPAQGDPRSRLGSGFPGNEEVSLSPA
jgi:DNA-binding NarL/FixJ family response regulator